MENTNSEFEIRGLNHVALVCKNMQRTVEFYTNVLGMELVKTIDLPGGVGQHFFFSMGGTQCFAFFWFTEAAERQPGISNPSANIDPAIIFTDPKAITSSHGSMNHQDPDGIVLEFAALQREFTPDLGDRTDVVPATSADRAKYRKMGEDFARQMAELENA